MIQTTYDSMWEQFQFASAHNQHETDQYLVTPHSDNRRGITALAYLDQANEVLLENIQEFQSAVRHIEPQQYFHPQNELHLTLLSVISCISGFQLSDIDADAYADVFHSALKNADPIQIQYRGVSASASAIVLQGFPKDNGLELLRDKLRSSLIKANLRHSFDTRYRLITAHSSLIRFKAPVNDSEELFALCQRYRNVDFGTAELSDFELVFNNWYQNLDVTKQLATHSLTAKEIQFA